jgi:hypothetical protein
VKGKVAAAEFLKRLSFPDCTVMMKRNTVWLAVIAMAMTFVWGCKDKPSEGVEKNESADSLIVDTMAVQDTVPMDAMDSLIAATPMPKAADGLFDDFLFNFTANKELQYERVRFPLKVVLDEKETFLEKKKWQMEKFFMKQGFYTLIFDSEEQMEIVKDTMVEKVIVEKIHLENKQVEQFYFERDSGQWMLTEIHRDAIYQNRNESFLSFYHHFASDSVFQIESLDEPVLTLMPDPEDDFTMIEGEFYPEQWDEFRPPVLPNEMIYNIIYGQTYDESTQKVFVIRGISNGLETEMTFRYKDGKWKLVKIVN